MEMNEKRWQVGGSGEATGHTEMVWNGLRRNQVRRRAARCSGTCGKLFDKHSAPKPRPNAA